jgi:hypothetical protein
MTGYSFVRIVRMLVLTFLFIFISDVCIAPTIGIHLKVVKFREISDYAEKRFHESEFTRFIDDLGYSESKNNWRCVNRIGCFGEWQFAQSTLHFLGYKKITLRKFKADPGIFPREMQRKALESLIKVNMSILRDYEHFLGDTINGAVITKSGMMAASHLGGARGLKLFLNSNGRINRKDVLGTSMRHYLNRFSNYDLE